MNYFVHSGSGGDILYSLPTIKTFGKSEIYLRGKFIRNLHRNYLGLLGRLLERQSYIKAAHRLFDYPDIKNLWDHKDVIQIDGKEVRNFDKFRIIDNINRGRKHLAECHLEIWNRDFNLNQAWLEEVEPNPIAPIVINCSERYHDKKEIDWWLLEKYKNDVVFVGRSWDYYAFPPSICGFALDEYPCKDALEVAEVIKGSKLFIGNQSLGFAIAEAMKHPRVLEIFYKWPNVMPHGENWYTHLDEELIERVVYGKS